LPSFERFFLVAAAAVYVLFLVAPCGCCLLFFFYQLCLCFYLLPFAFCLLSLGVRNRRSEGSPPAGAVVVQRGMRDRFILTRNSPARVNVGSREIESPTSSNNPTSVFNFQSQDKNKALIFGTLTMTMISLLSTLGDPFSNHMDRVEVKFAKAFLIFLPCVFWLECLMVAFIISLGAIWSMTGYKRFLYVSLSFALLYGITAWFAKAYAFKVLIGSNYMLNGAAFCGGYVIAVSIFVWPIIWFIVRYLIY
jgi:hypothetical protein